MIVVCPGCHARYRMHDGGGAGKIQKARCRRCGDTFPVNDVATNAGIGFLDPKAAVSGPGMKNVVAFSNQKGGVAKTTTCLNLGLSLSLLKKRVLLIDFDTQSNLTLSLGYRNQTSFFEIVDSGARDLMPHIIKTRYPGLWLLPANSNMALLNKRCFGLTNFEFVLRDRLIPLKDHFDFILIDTPPSIEFFTLNALTAARVAIIPCPCEFLSLHGVERIEKMMTLIQAKTNPRLAFRVLITMFDKSETAAMVIYKKLRNMYPDHLYRNVIEMDGKMKESQIAALPAIVYDGNSIAGRQYVHLAKEILSCAPFHRPIVGEVEQKPIRSMM